MEEIVFNRFHEIKHIHFFLRFLIQYTRIQRRTTLRTYWHISHIVYRQRRKPEGLPKDTMYQVKHVHPPSFQQRATRTKLMVIHIRNTLSDEYNLTDEAKAKPTLRREDLYELLYT